jgi:hypothetical protein
MALGYFGKSAVIALPNLRAAFKNKGIFKASRIKIKCGAAYEG